MSARPPNRSNLRAQDLPGIPKTDAEALVREIQERAQEGNTFAREILERLEAAESDIDTLESQGGGSGVNTPLAVYSSNTAQAMASIAFTVVNFEDVVVDTDTAVTTGAAWKFTIPSGEAGDYMVTAHVALTVTTSRAFHVALSVFKNGSEAARIYQHDGTTSAIAGEITLSGATLIPNLAAGDYLDIRLFQSTGGASRNTVATTEKNRVTIQRVR